MVLVKAIRHFISKTEMLVLLVGLVCAMPSTLMADHSAGHDTPGKPALVTLPKEDVDQFSMVPMRDGV
ncbi:hypothetical protein HBA55_36285 [Pseudomaricurvus alkylphenolicus]|uniref:hypothetical protein n=1 Tax=Pseudomaricurvus alkylphenolicus TaxID=1306991 RepID=UPI00141FB51C|nr:hypothetical protein [Pseudomaricurvus alkylphenolicus]NIB45094.1 hypothetical protein [Pseudomaricurvus alkylphenolicus]